jgi:hypothetical protein
MRTLLRLALLVPLAAPAADAATITVSFEGTVSEISEEVADGTFTIGEPVSGSFTIDTDTPDLEPAPDAGDYDEGMRDLSTQWGDYQASAASGLFYVRDRASGSDEIGFRAEPVGAPVNGLAIYTLYLYLLDSTQAAVAGDGIPASLDLADFDTVALSLAFEDPPFNYPVYAEVTSLTWTVPEPARAAPAAAGALALLALRRTARRSSPARP